MILPRRHPSQSARQKQNWDRITFLDEPCCYACGRPFEYDQGKSARCAGCGVNPPVYDQARSAILYNENSAPFILSFKHGGRTQYLDAFARQMHRAGRQFWPRADLILPVPLHPTRLVQRKFNQAALLAKRLAAITGVEYNSDLLFRHKATPSQGIRTAKGRRRNVQGAFSIADQARPLVKKKTVILIDDVLTTGATLDSCARPLRRAGAEQIFVVTLARVVRDIEIPT
ncbi:MAG: ComF family protein [Hellea sp.]|nr:ComF family protein [Hellea sp.]